MFYYLISDEKVLCNVYKCNVMKNDRGKSKGENRVNFQICYYIYFIILYYELEFDVEIQKKFFYYYIRYRF